MNTIERFVLDDRRYVIDILNPTRRKGYCHEESSETQMHLRERILIVRLADLVHDLVNSPRGEKDRSFDREGHSIWFALFRLIGATHLNALDPALSVQNRFDGKLKRQKEGLQAWTSLSLFTDDVERLLRDLYGDIDPEALDPVLRAAFVIVQEFTRYVRPDLWQEHDDAESLDYIWGIGREPGYGISGSQHSRGLAAANNLRLRARHVIEAPSTFSKYTVEFATKHVGNFIRMEKCVEADNDLPF